MTASDTGTLAALLADHEYNPAYSDRCDCGQSFKSYTAHHTHLAEVVAGSDWMRQQKAQAWAEWTWGRHWVGGWTPNPYRTTEDIPTPKCVCGHNEHGRVCFQECQDNTTDRT